MTDGAVTVMKYFKAETEEKNLRDGMQIKIKEKEENIFGEGTIELFFLNSERESIRFFIFRETPYHPLVIEHHVPRGYLHYTLIEVGEHMFELQMQWQHHENLPEYDNPKM